MDRIHITDLHIEGILGINPDERITPQSILINITLWVDTRPAATSDSIDDTVNYRTLTKEVIGHVKDGKPLLVERLAQEIANICLGYKGVESVEVSVDKPGALRHARSVGLTVRRSREDHHVGSET